MKNVKRIILSVLIAIILIGTVFPTLTVNAATKNTVKTSISKVVSKAKGFKVTWKKKSKIKGYQIQYSTSKKFTKSKTKTKTVSSAKSTSVSISKLAGCGKKYYVRIRTYTASNGKKVYSDWSKTKTVTTAKHKYEKATCTEAKTCKYCDKTSGKALGHKWKAATCTKAKTCTVCKKTSGKKLGHSYTAATCTAPKTCTTCGKTSGKKLSHSYVAATCIAPKTCSVCGATKGSAAGHNWKAATCTEAKICNTCGETEGKPKGHNYTGEKCSDCGQENPMFVKYRNAVSEIETEYNRLVAETHQEHSNNLKNLAGAKLEAESEIGALSSARLSELNSLNNQKNALISEKERVLANALANTGGQNNSYYETQKKQYESKIAAVDNQIGQTNSKYGKKIAEWETYLNNLPTVADYEDLRDLKLSEIEIWKNQQIQDAKNYYGIS